jgi:hypothetical protein
MNDCIDNPNDCEEIFLTLDDTTFDSKTSCLDNILNNANGHWPDVMDYFDRKHVDIVDMIFYLNEEKEDYDYLVDWVLDKPNEYPPYWDGDYNDNEGSSAYENEADRISHMTSRLASNYDKLALPSTKLKIAPPALLIDMVYKCANNACTGNYVVSGNDPNHNGGFKDGLVPCGTITEAAGQLAAYEYAIYLEKRFGEKVSDVCHYVHEAGDAQCLCELDVGDVMYLTAEFDGMHRDNQGTWGTLEYNVKGYVNGKLCFDDESLAVVFKDLEGIGKNRIGNVKNIRNN